MSNGWYGFDLDGTLTIHGTLIPIPKMVNRVKRYLRLGREVRIVTARAGDPDLIPEIEQWSENVFGVVLQVTDKKDFGMIRLWDDRAVGVIMNTGERADGLEDDD